MNFYVKSMGWKMKHKDYLLLSLMIAMVIISIEKLFLIHSWLSVICWMWLLFVGAINLILEIKSAIKRSKKKKRRRKVSNDTQSNQLNRSINFAETQIK